MPSMVAAALKVSGSDRRELERLWRSSSLPNRTVVQAATLLLVADRIGH